MVHFFIILGEKGTPKQAEWLAKVLHLYFVYSKLITGKKARTLGTN